MKSSINTPNKKITSLGSRLLTSSFAAHIFANSLIHNIPKQRIRLLSSEPNSNTRKTFLSILSFSQIIIILDYDFALLHSITHNDRNNVYSTSTHPREAQARRRVSRDFPPYALSTASIILSTNPIQSSMRVRNAIETTAIGSIRDDTPDLSLQQ